MDRPITPHEAAIIRWLLDHASRRDVAAYRRQPLDELRVVADAIAAVAVWIFSRKLQAPSSSPTV